MSINHTCKKCKQNYILTRENHQTQKVRFSGFPEYVYKEASKPEINIDSLGDFSSLDIAKIGTNSKIEFLICPDESCNFVETIFTPVGKSFVNKSKVSIQPSSLELRLPVELQNSVIIDDLREAFSIQELSPRASIVISRRALHSMIRDTFNLTTNNTLDRDISGLSSITNINLVGTGDIDTLHKIRQIGNDGAHGPLDVTSQAAVTSEDAYLVIEFILSFVEKWYVAPELERKRLQNLVNLHNKVK